MERCLEADLDSLDSALALAEKQAAAALASLRALRKLAAEGDVGALARRLPALAAAAAPLADAIRHAAAGFTYDAVAAMADGSLMAELAAEAKRQQVTLVVRDGRISAFPLLLRLDPQVPGVRVGKRLVRGIRPSRFIQQLRASQQGSNFSPETFLEMLYRAALLRGGRGADLGKGISLNDIYEVIVLRPGSGGEYSRDAFAVDLLRLNRSPGALTRDGHRFAFTASTGSKGRERFAVYDEHGVEHVFVGISFHRGI